MDKDQMEQINKLDTDFDFLYEDSEGVYIGHAYSCMGDDYDYLYVDTVNKTGGFESEHNNTPKEFNEIPKIMRGR